MIALPAILAGRRRRILLRLIANGIGQALAGLAAALAMRQVFDRHFGDQAAPPDSVSLAVLGAALASAAVAAALLRWLERVDSEKLGQAYARDIRACLFDHLSRVPARQLQQRRQGGLVLRFVSDMTALRNWASRGLARLWVGGVMALGVLTGLAYLDRALAAVVATTIGFGVAATWATHAALDQRVRMARRRQGSLAANINEKLARLAVVQAFGRRSDESRRIAQQSRRLQRAMVSRARIAGLSIAIAALTGSLASLGVLLVGASSSGASRGTVVAAIALVGLLITPLHQLGRIAELWRSASLSREKLEQVLDSGTPLVNAPNPVKLSARGAASVHFESVSVDGALEPLTATAEPEQRILITGPHASGKSTLLLLVPRLAEPTAGRVDIDGVDIARISLGSLRRAVSMATDDLPLLRGTLRANLCYRKPGASASEVRRTLGLCGLDQLVARLPHGIDTMLSESAANLSQGERRRLMWARALMGDPRVLLLDDVDANLDADTQQQLARLLREYRGTVLMTAQQPLAHVSPDAIWTLTAVPERPSPSGIVARTEAAWT